MSFEVGVPSTLIVTNSAAETSVNMCTHVTQYTLVSNDFSAAQFVTVNVDCIL